jgi:hypothetical protein
VPVADPSPEQAPAPEAAPPPEQVPAPDPAPAPEHAPSPERRTIQIGERPGPLRVEPPQPPHETGWRGSLDKWGPRVLAAIMLLVLAALVFLLVGVAL